MRRPTAILWVSGIVSWAFSLVVTGYNAGASNKSIQLALVHLLREPSLYPHDPVRDTLYSYVSALWWLIAWLPASVPVDLAEGAFFLLTRAILIYSAYRLARALAPDSLLAQVSGMCLVGLVPHPQLGGGMIVESYFEQTGTAIPFILLATAAFLEKRFYHAAIWLGIAFNITLIYASFTLVYLGAAVFVHPQWRSQWKELLKSLVLFGVCTIPTWAIVAQHFSPSVFDVDLWYQVQRVRSPFHLFPLYFSLLSWAKYLVSVMFSLIILTIVGKYQPLWRQFGFVWTFASMFFVVWAFVPAYLLKSPLLLVMQTARATDVWACLVGVLTAVGTAYLVERSLASSSVKDSLVHVFLWILCLNLWSFKSHLLAFPKMASMVVGGAGVLFVLRRYNRDAVSILLSISMVAMSLVALWRNPPDRKFYKDAPIFPVAQWAKQHTPRDAVFLIPPGSQDAWPLFRALSERSVFVTWKDGTNVFFAPGYTEHWVERIACLGFDIRQHRLGWRQRSPVDASNINQLYLRLSDGRVRDLAARYGIDYWVVPTEKPSRFPVVFSDGRWKVLQVRTPATSTIPTSQPSRESHR